MREIEKLTVGQRRALRLRGGASSDALNIIDAQAARIAELQMELRDGDDVNAQDREALQSAHKRIAAQAARIAQLEKELSEERAARLVKVARIAQLEQFKRDICGAIYDESAGEPV